MISSTVMKVDDSSGEVNNPCCNEFVFIKSAAMFAQVCYICPNTA